MRSTGSCIHHDASTAPAAGHRAASLPPPQRTCRSVPQSFRRQLSTGVAPGVDAGYYEVSRRQHVGRVAASNSDMEYGGDDITGEDVSRFERIAQSLAAKLSDIADEEQDAGEDELQQADAGLLPFGVTKEQASSIQAKRQQTQQSQPEAEEQEGFAIPRAKRKSKRLPDAALPKVAIVGRPNVGKSCLFNRIAGASLAVVYDEPGVTRDRLYTRSKWGTTEFVLVDTGGLMSSADELPTEQRAAAQRSTAVAALPAAIERQAAAGVAESDVVVLLVDGKAGLQAGDREILGWLRSHHPDRRVLLAVNKCDHAGTADLMASEFWELGLEPMPLSAINGSGTGDLLDALVKALPPPKELDQEAENTPLAVAIVGRPNVGLVGKPYPAPAAYCKSEAPPASITRQPIAHQPGCSPHQQHLGPNPSCHLAAAPPSRLARTCPSASASAGAAVVDSSTLQGSSDQVDPDVLIEFKNVYKSFGDKAILRGASFKIRRGEAVGIIGASGTGKSTTLRLAAGLIAPDSGEVCIMGHPRTGLLSDQTEEEQLKIGMVFQNAALFDSLTVGENVGFLLYEHSNLPEDRIKQLVADSLGKVGLPGVEKLYPAELSGGMKKRVALARAVVTDVRDTKKEQVIMYDEPTAGLDPVASTVVEDLMRSLHNSSLSNGSSTNGGSQQRMGISSYIVVTHQHSTIRRAVDRIIFLHKGRVVWEGSVKEFDTTAEPIVRQFAEGTLNGPIQYL